MKVICDTGVISRYLTKANIKIVNRINENIGEENICVTVVTIMELLNWLSGYPQLDKKLRKEFSKKIKELEVIHINENISKIALELTDKHPNSKPSDTLIGSISIYNQLPLYTLNKKDFTILKVQLY